MKLFKIAFCKLLSSQDILNFSIKRFNSFSLGAALSTFILQIEKVIKPQFLIEKWYKNGHFKQKYRKLGSVAFRAVYNACDHVIGALFPECYTSIYRRLDIETLLSVDSKSS